MPEWTLYGQKLDLEEFKKNHPGGELALLLGEERDCTRLFEQYHCRNASNQTVLKQLAKEQGKEIDPTIKDPFQQEVLQMAYDYKGGYTASKPKQVFLACVGILLTITIIGWVLGSWSACLLLPVLAWLLMVNASHDAAHFAFSDTPWINKTLSLLSAPLFFNTSVWYLQHNVSHHIHTNEIDKDIDLYHGAPVVRSHDEVPWVSSNALQPILVPFVHLFIATFSQIFIYPFAVLWKHPRLTKMVGMYDAFLKHSTPNIILQLSISIIFAITPFLLFKWPKALAFFLIPYAISSILFMLVTQVSHLQEETQPKTVSENWMRQMVETSMDYSQDSAFWCLMTGGLNMQSIHHCVPAIDSSQLIELYPKFRAICQKHGVNINEVPTFWDAIKKYWLHIHNLSKEPPTKGEGCPVAH